MKGKRLADVLDNYTTPPKSKLGDTILKLVKLVVAIETKKGPQMNIDDHDYRWAKDIGTRRHKDKKKYTRKTKHKKRLDNDG